TTLVNTTPAMTLTISWMLGMVRPSKTNLIGLVLTLVGIASMSVAEYSISPANITGDAAALAGAFSWATYLTVGRDVRERANPITVMPYIYLISASILAASGYLFNGRLLIPDVSEVGPVLAVAFFPTVLGHTLQFSSLRGLRAFETSTLALLEPIVASVLAFLIFSEAPAAGFYLSAAIILAGIYLVLK
ncbi:MAG: DMT family transporter, partial [Nitrososphaerota archaeon]